MKRKVGYATFNLNIKDEFPLRMTTAHGMKIKSCVLNKAETKCLFRLLKLGYAESEALRPKRKAVKDETH